MWIWSWPILKNITRDFWVTISSDRPEVSTRIFYYKNQDCQLPKDEFGDNYGWFLSDCIYAHIISEIRQFLIQMIQRDPSPVVERCVCAHTPSAFAP
jgi:hypothetical protein